MERALQGKLGWEKWVMGSNSMGNLEENFREEERRMKSYAKKNI